MSTPLQQILKTGAAEFWVHDAIPRGGSGPSHMNQAFCRVLAERFGKNYDIKALLAVLSTDARRGEERLAPLMEGVEDKKGQLRNLLRDLFNQDKALAGVGATGSPTLLHLSAFKGNDMGMASYFMKFVKVALQASHKGKEQDLERRLSLCCRILTQASSTVKLVDEILVKEDDDSEPASSLVEHWLVDCEEVWWIQFCAGLERLLVRLEEGAEQADYDVAYGVPLIMHLVRWLSVGWFLLLLNGPLAWCRRNGYASDGPLNYPLYLVPERATAGNTIHTQLTSGCFRRIQALMDTNLLAQVAAGFLKEKRSPLKGRAHVELLTVEDIDSFRRWLADSVADEPNIDSPSCKKRLGYEESFLELVKSSEGKSILDLLRETHGLLKPGTTLGVIQVDKPSRAGWLFARNLGLAGPRYGKKAHGFYVQPELFESIYFALVSPEEREGKRRLQETFHARMKELGLHVGGSGTVKAMRQIEVLVPVTQRVKNPDHANEYVENKVEVEIDLVSKDLVRQLADGVTVVER